MLGDPAKLAQNAEPGKNVAALLNNALVMEPKYDGFRLLLHRGPHGVDTFTRTGKSQKGKLPHLEAALCALPEGTWLDGELVAFDAKGMPEWGKVQSCMGSNAGDPRGTLTYVVFDMLAYASIDIRPLPLSDRRTALLTALDEMNEPRLQITPQHKASDELHDEYVERGYEGTIVKDPSKPYASGKRGKGWWKLKASDEMDVVIMGFKPGENSFTGMIGAIEFGQYVEADFCPQCVDDPQGQRWLCLNRPHMKVLKYRGRCSGMDIKTRQWMTANQQQLIADKQVISLAYMGIMPSGSPRHPQYKRLRIDKPAEECKWA